MKAKKSLVPVMFSVTLVPFLLLVLMAFEERIPWNIPRDEVLFFGLIIVVVGGVTLCGWVFQDVIRPLRSLQAAMKEIRDGNLDFTLEVDSDSEIGMLCRDFEEMRIRLKESAEEKVAYDKESKMLLSNISHDLRTPLTAIKGYVEGIRDGVASSPEKLDKYIRTIYNKTMDMDRLLDELTF
ncbi:MAG TPA: hypothetical protein DCG70_00590, partial [Lachnoclostridium sp.]|nr:hypothetical protein [Lachnoclostridium sp.]